MTEPVTLSSPSRAFTSRWRALAADPGARKKIRVALVASFTADPLVPFLGCFLAERGLIAEITVAPFNQVYQSLLDPSALPAGLDVIVVLARLEDLRPDALARLDSLDPSEIATARAEVIAEAERLGGTCREAAERTSATVITATFPPPPSTPLGVLDAGHPASRRRLDDEANVALWRSNAGSNRVLGFDVAAVVADVGLTRAHDPRMWFLSRCPYSSELLRALGASLARALTPLFVAPAKVVVLDLDNTLWGGVVGEDGASGIDLGPGAIGDAFVAFQAALLALREQGVLLALASKNNEADAWEAIDGHPRMQIRRRHLAASRVSWQPKSESLKQLAKELSLGLDSFVFLDDSPVERDEVRRALPDVIVPDLPEDPAELVRFLRALPCLDRVALTPEDRARPDQYAALRARGAALEAVPPGDPAALLAHLASLELRIEVRRLRATDVTRAAQLTQKTNQFNLTTIRRTDADVDRLRTDARYRVFAVDVADRFGDYGFTGLVIVEQTGEAAFDLDTMLLSCRVLGRKVETAVLGAVVAALRDEGATTLTGRFVPTPKNAPAAGFLAEHGFSPRGDAFVLEPLSTHRCEVSFVKVCSLTALS